MQLFSRGCLKVCDACFFVADCGNAILYVTGASERRKVSEPFFNFILEHVSTPVPTVDNIHIQIYMYIYAYIGDKKIHPYRHPYRQIVGQSTS